MQFLLKVSFELHILFTHFDITSLQLLYINFKPNKNQLKDDTWHIELPPINQTVIKSSTKQPESDIHTGLGCLIFVENVGGCRNGYNFGQHVSLLICSKSVAIKTFRFEMAKEVLYTCVIPTVSLSGHTGDHFVSFKTLVILARSILKPLVTMHEDSLNLPFPSCLFEEIHHKLLMADRYSFCQLNIRQVMSVTHFSFGFAAQKSLFKSLLEMTYASFLP